ncbi:MAG: hypothetical protein QOH50_5014 [Kribbellaceae bacterium]|nr:hypothetical protein [Kribbellaceae bacterium]
MSFSYNASCILRVIRKTENNISTFTFTNVMGTELSHHGHIVNLNMIKTMVEGQLERYQQLLKELLFFGEDILSELKPEFNIESLVDDVQNRNTGYTFVEDPRNSLGKYKDAYGLWLLSTEARRKCYTYYNGRQLVWNTKRAIDIINSFQRLDLELAPGLVFSAGPSTRGTEFSRQLYRQMPGSIRNVGIVLHTLSLNATTDKTSHQRMVDFYIPHVPTREWALVFLRHLAIFRPFVEYLVEQLFEKDQEIIKRYRFYLWPGLSECLTSHVLSDKMNQITRNFLGEGYGIKLWRSLTTVVLQRVSDNELVEINRQYYFDTANMHTTSTAISKYGGNLDGGDSRLIAGCVRVGLAWHKRIGIGQTRPYGSAEVIEVESRSEPKNVNMDGVVEKIKDFCDESISTIRATVSESMAECSLLYFPPPPRPRTSLPIISEIEVHPSRLAAFRIFMGNPEAQWSCPEQGVFVEHLVGGRENILGIIGTGFGKMTVIMFVAKTYLQGKSTVVIMPLAFLHADFHRRALSYGLKASRWHVSGKFDSTAHIITAAVEDLQCDGFVQFLNEKANRKELYRVGFEEIHKLWSDISYRPAFNFIHRISSAHVPVFGTTGTLPEHLLSSLPKMTSTFWKIIRMPSNRKELIYDVVRVPWGESLNSAVAGYWRDVSTTYKEEDRCLVFCRTVSQAKTFGKLIHFIGNVKMRNRWIVLYLVSRRFFRRLYDWVADSIIPKFEMLFIWISRILLWINYKRIREVDVMDFLVGRRHLSPKAYV